MNVLELRGEDFDGDGTSCTGEQVAAVLDVIVSTKDLSGFTWYAAALVSYPPICSYREQTFQEIPDIGHLIESLKATESQLDDGIAVAVLDNKPPETPDGAVSADGPLHKFVMHALVEIHAFDTSCLEVYTDDPSLIAALQSCFGGKLLSFGN